MKPYVITVLIEIKLLEAENKRLREALEARFDNPFPTHWDPHGAAFAAGAASRDDEVALLKADNELLRKALFDQLNDCINFDGGKLTTCIMQASTAALAATESMKQDWSIHYRWACSRSVTMDAKNLKRWIAVGAGGDTVRLLPVDVPSTGPDVFVKLLDADAAIAAAFEAGKRAERNRCRYPGCTENEDERCPRWLTGECGGPNQK